MKKMLIATIFFNLSLFADLSLPSHPSVQAFQRELGIKVVKGEEEIPENASTLYLVQHGSTEWSEIKRLQGWTNLPLNENGKLQIETLAEKIRSVAISAIYTSSIQSCIETGEILKERFTDLTVTPMDELKGEFHGKFEGYTRDQYLKNPHFQLYYFLPAEEEIFFPCGKEGESKADVARRAVPALKKIAENHAGQSVIVVAHEGLFKVFNYYAGKYKPETTLGLEYGEVMEIKADATTLYLPKLTPDSP